MAHTWNLIFIQFTFILHISQRDVRATWIWRQCVILVFFVVWFIEAVKELWLVQTHRTSYISVACTWSYSLEVYCSVLNADISWNCLRFGFTCDAVIPFWLYLCSSYVWVRFLIKDFQNSTTFQWRNSFKTTSHLPLNVKETSVRCQQVKELPAR